MKQEEANNEPIEDKPKARKKRRWRWLLFIPGVPIVLLLGLQLAFTYYADAIIGTVLKGVVDIKSDGVYVLEYDSIQLDLVKNELNIEGLEISIDSSFYAQLDDSARTTSRLRHLRFPSVSIADKGIGRFYFNRKLQLKHLILENPEVCIDLGKVDPDKSKPLFTIPDLYSLISGYLDDIKVDDVAIEKGSLCIDVLSPRESPKSYQIRDISIYANGLKIDSVSGKNDNLPFHADGAELLLGRNELATEDGSSYSFQDIKYSTTSARIDINGIVYRDAKKKNINKWSLPTIQISGIDLPAIYLDRSVLLDSIAILQPIGEAFVDGEAKRTLHEVLNKHLNVLGIKKASLLQGNITISGDSKGNVVTYHIPDIDLLASDLYIDSTTTDEEKKRLYSKDLTAVLRDYKEQLPDSLHSFFAKKIWISTGEQRLEVEGIEVNSNRDYNRFLSSGQGKIKALYDIELPAAKANGFSVWNWYEQKRINVRQLNLLGMKFNVYNKRYGDKVKPNQLDIRNLYPIIQDKLVEITIDELRLSNARFYFARTRDDRKSQLNVNNISLNLEGFVLDSNSNKNEKQLFYSDQFNARASELSLLLSDSLHRVELNEITASTKSKSLKARKFHMYPIASLDSTIIGDEEETDQLLDVSLEELTLEAVDFSEAWYDRVYHIGRMGFDNPDVKVFGIGKRGGLEGDTVARIKTRFLSDYFKSVQVDNLELNNGELNYFLSREDSIPKLHSSDISLCLMDVISDTAALRKGELLFSAGDIDFSANDYQLLLRDGFHVMDMDRIRVINSIADIYARSFHIHPLDRYKGLGKNNLIDIKLPKIRLKGVDIHKAIIDGNLTVGKLSSSKPELDLVLFQHNPREDKDFDIKDIKRSAKKLFKTWKVDSTVIKNGSFSMVNYLINENDSSKVDGVSQLKASDFSISIDKFKLDSTSNLDSINFMFSKDINLVVKDIHEKLPDSTYEIYAKEVGFSTQRGYVYADSVTLEPIGGLLSAIEEDKGGGTFGFHLPKAELFNLDFFKMAEEKEFKASLLSLEHPSFSLKQETKSSEGESKKRLNIDSLFNQLPPAFHSYDLQQVAIRDASLDLYNKENSGDPICLFNVSVTSDSLYLDSSAHLNKNRLLYSQDLSVSIRDYSIPTPDSLYTIAFKNLNLSYGKSLLAIDSLQLIPYTDKYKFAIPMWEQTDWISMSSEKLLFEDLSVEKLVKEGALDAHFTQLDGLFLHIYRDKRFRFPEDQRPTMPQQLIKDAGFYIRLDSVQLNDAYVRYEEFAECGYQEGYIFFEDLNITGSNITNDSILLARGVTTHLSGSALLMGNGKLDAQFEFQLGSDIGEYSYTGTLYEMDITDVNPMLENVAFVKVEKGKVKKMELGVTANNHYAEGKMKFYYNNLEVSLLDENTLESGFDERMEALFANTFIVHSNNPRFIIPRKGRIFFIRDKSRSIFNFWAHTTFQGLKKSAATRIFLSDHKRKELKKQQEDSERE